MRIAQLRAAWPSGSRPPSTAAPSGSSRRLTEELVRRGHEVTLFASGDSRTAAALVPVTARALRLDPDRRATPTPTPCCELGRSSRAPASSTVIHNHLDYFALPFARLVRTPVVTTLHGRLDLPDLPAIFARYRDQPLVSISASQRAPLAGPTGSATVYNGIDLGPYRLPRAAPGDYFAFIGRISPEKNLEGAIAIARATGIPLKIAAKVDPVDAAYYEADIKPLIDGRLVEYVGRDRRAREGRLPRPGLCAPLPDGLARAVRAGDGRGDGLRHAGAGAAARRGARGGRGRRDRLRARHEAELAAAAWRIPELDRARLPPARGGALQRRGDGRRLRGGLPGPDDHRAATRRSGPAARMERGAIAGDAAGG